MPSGRGWPCLWRATRRDVDVERRVGFGKQSLRVGQGCGVVGPVLANLGEDVVVAVPWRIPVKRSDLVADRPWLTFVISEIAAGDRALERGSTPSCPARSNVGSLLGQQGCSPVRRPLTASRSLSMIVRAGSSPHDAARLCFSLLP